MQRGVADSPALDTGHSGGNAQHDIRPGERKPSNSLVDEIAQHFLSNDVVGYHAVAHRAHNLDRLAWLTAKHIARLKPHRSHAAITGRDRDNGRLVNDDPASTHEYQNVGRPKVDT